MAIDTLELAKQLIARPSVTPDDAGCLDLLTALLEPAGFVCEKISMGGVDNLWARRGTAAPLVDVRLRTEDGTDAPWDGQTMGEIQVRGPFITGAYHRVGATPDKFTADGWLRTGDVASVDALGFVKISDRTKDLIKSGGEWISSLDLEAALAGHPAVQEAAVIGIAHPRWDERPLAVEYSTVPAYCLPSLEAVEDSLYVALDAAGARPARALQRLRAAPFAEEQAALLEVPPGHAGLLTRYRLGLAAAAGAEIELKSIITAVDTRHPTTGGLFVQACSDVAAWTGDLDFLRAALPRMRRAIEYSLREFRVTQEHHVFVPWVGHDGRSGLDIGPDGAKTVRVGLGVGNNYWDLLPFGGHDAVATLAVPSPSVGGTVAAAEPLVAGIDVGAEEPLPAHAAAAPRATSSTGTVSRAMAMPRYVVPQTMQTVRKARYAVDGAERASDARTRCERRRWRSHARGR